MPFADAKYPPTSVKQDTSGDRMTQVPLANGETLLVIEATEPEPRLVLAMADREHPSYIELYVCEITHRGVLAHAYSDDAGERLARRPNDA